MRLLPVLTLATGLIAGLLLDVALRPAPARPAPPTTTIVPAAERSCPAAGASVDPALVRRLVAEALADTRAPAPPEEPPAAPAPSPERVAAAAEAADLVDRAVSAGRWTDADARGLRARLPLLTAEAREEALSRFFGALNSGRLRVETEGRPL
jgi:hypothetical protein